MRLDLSFRFDPWYARVPASPTDEGTLDMLVSRPSGGERATPARGRLEPDRGLLGDRWVLDPERNPDSQVSLMNVRVARALERDPARWPLFGDNLMVDLCLEEASLPVGTRLQVGEAWLEVTPALHRPCAKFVERFGATAAKRVARAGRRGKRARGVMCRVIRAGDVCVGDVVRVLSRP